MDGEEALVMNLSVGTGDTVRSAGAKRTRRKSGRGLSWSERRKMSMVRSARSKAVHRSPPGREDPTGARDVPETRMNPSKGDKDMGASVQKEETSAKTIRRSLAPINHEPLWRQLQQEFAEQRRKTAAAQNALEIRGRRIDPDASRVGGKKARNAREPDGAGSEGQRNAISLPQKSVQAAGRQGVPSIEAREHTTVVNGERHAKTHSSPLNKRSRGLQVTRSLEPGNECTGSDDVERNEYSRVAPTSTGAVKTHRNNGERGTEPMANEEERPSTSDSDSSVDSDSPAESNSSANSESESSGEDGSSEELQEAEGGLHIPTEKQGTRMTGGGVDRKAVKVEEERGGPVDLSTDEEGGDGNDSMGVKAGKKETEEGKHAAKEVILGDEDSEDPGDAHMDVRKGSFASTHAMGGKGKRKDPVEVHSGEKRKYPKRGGEGEVESDASAEDEKEEESDSSAEDEKEGESDASAEDVGEEDSDGNAEGEEEEESFAHGTGEKGGGSSAIAEDQGEMEFDTNVEGENESHGDVDGEDGSSSNADAEDEGEDLNNDDDVRQAKSDAAGGEDEHLLSGRIAAEVANVRDKQGEEGTSEEKEAPVQNSLFSDVGFDMLGLSPTLTHHMKSRMGLKHPTKVQCETVKALVPQDNSSTFRDAMVRSETGSGKTLAFLVPIAHSLLERRKKVERTDGTLAVILEPTRELAAQVEIVAKKLFRPWHWIVVSAVMGGEKKKSEKARLRRGVTVLITTPGRMVDHLRSTRSLKLANCEWLVFDEADRLLDLGFGPSIRETIETLDQRLKEKTLADEAAGTRSVYRKRRQTVLLSATVTNGVVELAKLSLDDPARVVVDNVPTANAEETNFKVPDRLQQHFCVVDQRHRLVTLLAILRLRARADPATKAVVFFSSCDAVDFHYVLFNQASYPEQLLRLAGEGEDDEEDDADEEEDEEESAGPSRRRKRQPKSTNTSLCRLSVHKLHGSMPQVDRISTFRKFLEAKGGILLSTDVAARGVDLSNVTLSVQYDPPTHDEDVEYVHRAGRTARIGSVGDALLFVLPEERTFVDHLTTSRGFDMKEISADAALSALAGTVKDLDRSSRLVTSILQSTLQHAVDSDPQLKALASMGYRSHIRAYKTHGRSVKSFFNTNNLHLGHVARSFGLKGAPLTVSEARRALEGRGKGQLNSSSALLHSNKRGRSPYGTVTAAVGNSRHLGREAHGSAERPKRRRRTLLSAPTASRLLAAEFGV